MFTPIDEKSPLFGLSLKDLEARDAEIIILVKAISDTFGQTIYSRNSYKAEQMVENAKFKPIIPVPNKEGKLKMTVTDIHEFEVLK